VCLALSAVRCLADDADDTRWAPRVEIAATGGFAGLAQVTVQTVPNLICSEQAVLRNPAGTPTTVGVTPSCTVDPNNVVAIKNTTHNWKPATSTGIIFRWIVHKDQDDEKNDGFGVGVGTHFVFVPSEQSTRAAPAITFHMGKKGLQVFGGWIFVRTDSVELPGLGERAVVPATFTTSSLTRTEGGREATFFAGIVIGALSITKPK
jgi:hypothetical protein